jgi:hypothetical protein
MVIVHVHEIDANRTPSLGAMPVTRSWSTSYAAVMEDTRKSGDEQLDLRWQKFYAWSGLIFAVLAGVGWFGIKPPRHVQFDLPAADAAKWYIEHRTEYLWGIVFFEFAFVFYLFWAVQLTLMLWRLEGGSRLRTIGSSLTNLSVPLIMFADLGVIAACAYRAPVADPEVTRALSDVYIMIALIFWPVLIPAMGFAGLVMWRTRNSPTGFPSWAAWLSFIAAPISVLWQCGIFDTGHGVLSVNGLIGYYIPMATWGAWAVAITIAMIQVLNRTASRETPNHGWDTQAEPSPSLLADRRAT